MIKVLIVNDSVMVQQSLKRKLTEAGGFEVVGIAVDGFDGIAKTRSCDPDVILMDISMPRCGGVQATKEIMEKYPRPILIVTATIRAHMPYVYECLSYGALEVIKTPTMERDNYLLDRVKIAHSLRSITVTKTKPKVAIKEDAKLEARPPQAIRGGSARKVVAIGASTGGPSAILKVLRGLPMNTDAGIILVQHIDHAFAAGLAEWFNANCPGLNIYACRKGDKLVKGTGYLACENKDLVVGQDLLMSYDEPVRDPIFSPCIDVTFASVARVFGKNAVGVLLTGMGDDGAKGLKAMRDAGASTIAQDEESSLIYGMPKAAKDLGAAEFVLPLDKIGAKIGALL